MAFAPSSPVTGATVTGLTSPTFTLTADFSPNPLAKQLVVTNLGGTQPDVSVHSVASPFLVSFARPSSFKMLGAVNPATGRLTSVPRNNWKLIAIKGATPLAGQPSVPIIFRGEFSIPAGVDLADPNEVKAFMSFLGGLLYANANGLASSFNDGIL